MFGLEISKLKFDETDKHTGTHTPSWLACHPDDEYVKAVSSEVWKSVCQHGVSVVVTTPVL